MISGKVYPENVYKVSLYSVLDGLISNVITDTKGNFAFNTPLDESKSNILYVICYSIELPNIVKLLSIVSKPYFVINELTTVAALYCFNNFYNTNSMKISGDSKGLYVANKMYLNFVDNYGNLSEVIKTSPNAFETNSMQLFNSLGNLIRGCINNIEVFNNVATFTTVDLVIPSDTLQIITSIVRYPSNNIKSIFIASFINKVYTPYLSSISAPDAFTLAIKVNDSGNDNYLIGGAGNIVFDNIGRAWITNNAIQGTPNSSNFTIVLEPDGKPSSISPLFGGGCQGAGFGIVQYFNNIIVGNFGWGDSIPNGGLSIYRLDGTPLTGSEGYNNKLYRVQGMSVDNNNNIWITSYGNNTIVVLLNGDLNNKLIYYLDTNSDPFDIVNDSIGCGIISYSGDKTLIKLQINKEQTGFNVIYNISAGPKLLGLSIDSYDNVFAASPENSSIYKIDINGNILMTINGNGIYTPWSCTVDGDNNVWVANFAADLSTNLYGVPVFTNDGIFITPNTGYTLPTGGDQVLLHNGTPLYGVGSAPSYNPLMKQTAIKIDSAGNVWITNNFKPSTPEDNNNPSGDGVVIFVGIGKPGI